MEFGNKIPIQFPEDALKQGEFRGPAFQQVPTHPLQQQLAKNAELGRKQKNFTLANVFGSAMPLSMEMERRVLNRQLRLPSLPSEANALDILEGRTCTFGFEDMFAREPETSAELHKLAEKQLGLTSKVHF